MSQKKRLCLNARCVLPVCSPPIENGCVLIEKDRILAVGQKDTVSRNSNFSQQIDCGDSIILPALINSHAHLDYTNFAGAISKKDSFTLWIKAIIEKKKETQDYEKSWLAGAEMLLNTGAGYVADIESVPRLLPGVWNAAGLKITSFIEIIGVKDENQTSLKQLVELIDTFRDRNSGKTFNRLGVSPHSLYSTTAKLLRESFDVARRYNLPVSIHLAESDEEYEMFKYRSGNLYEWLKEIGRNMDDCGMGSPVHTLFSNYNPPKRLIIAHGNYLDDDDINLLAKNNATVVHCPSSFRFFAHRVFKYDKLVNNKINICLGTDSLASAEGVNGEKPTLNMFNEMRLFSKVFNDVNPEKIVEMATINGANALNLNGKVGLLAPNACADLIAIPFTGKIDEAYDAVVNFTGSVLFSLINGEMVCGVDYYRQMFEKVC